MAKSVFVLGMDITWNSARGDSAQLNVSRPLREINSEKFKRRTIGESGDVNPQWDQPLMIDHTYALRLERTGVLLVNMIVGHWSGRVVRLMSKR
ncbi:integrase phage related protein [Vibrio harveyi CAIM 1792]|nr:integrase phage related protein [Vibrio harveyi CAIM 1792]